MADPTLVLPGDLPGLIREQSPVVYDGFAGTVLSIHGDTAAVAWVEGTVAGHQIVGRPSLPLRTLQLDLTRATGRAHAAWWLEKAIVEQTALVRPSRMVLPATPGVGWFFGTKMFAHLCTGLTRNGTLLPDGSSWADAEILRRVCLFIREANHVH